MILVVPTDPAYGKFKRSMRSIPREASKDYGGSTYGNAAEMKCVDIATVAVIVPERIYVDNNAACGLCRIQM
jgi:hypothetical protein